MRILHVLGKLDRGGVETWLVQVLRHIDRSKYQFDFLVHNGGEGAYDDEVRALGARVIPCMSPSNPVKFTRDFLRILKEYGPYDCVHSHVHHYSGYVLMLARMAGVNGRICHSHCDTRVTDKQRGRIRGIYRSAMSQLLRTASTTGLAVSEKAAKSLFGENWTADQRWKISYLGIDLEPFSRDVDRRSTRVELGIDDSAFVIGHVGRFFPQKNHSFFMEIAKHVCDAQPNACFLLVGDGPLRAEMEAKSRALGVDKHIKFAGLRNDVPRLMKGAMDVFLFPSLFEGFPVVLMEAQAAGLQCFIADNISNEIDIFPEYVHRFSLSTDPRVWAAAVLDKRPLLESTSLKTMRNFSIEAAVSRLCEAYDGY